MIDQDHLRLLEAILFAAAEPLSVTEIERRLPPGAAVEALIGALAAAYEGHGVNLVERGGRFAFRTASDLAGPLSASAPPSRKLSRAAVETLAIIAYHQPVTRAEIEEMRGVALGKGTLDLLFEAGWIRPRGRRQTPGRPMLWGTTNGFLDHFGLSCLDELPGLSELKAAGLLAPRPSLARYANHGSVDGEGGDEAANEDSHAET